MIHLLFQPCWWRNLAKLIWQGKKRVQEQEPSGSHPPSPAGVSGPCSGGEEGRADLGAAGFPEGPSQSLPARGEGQQEGEEEKRHGAALTW